ncbi:MAG: hypothetical protein K5841_01410, partial [Fretibacterium sp.]|nr:hypothetical protein [Fretibacterium sp.]
MLIGVEIGGTKLQVAAGLADGTLLQTVRGKVDVSAGSIGILKWLKENVSREIQAQRDAATAIGVG